MARPGRPKRAVRRHDVLNMPPPWRRSLTESGMRRRVTRFDQVVVALFVVAALGLVTWSLLATPWS